MMSESDSVVRGNMLYPGHRLKMIIMMMQITAIPFNKLGKCLWFGFFSNQMHLCITVRVTFAF